ncbi:Cytochrome P450 76C1 [Morus notabilis]|uniref:Cytochrome P450 76C1 n=1 Tax=Morus notabilis TaxID=981085 RepID=W9RVY9_9ROSA|nr:Cytochrome P450 76C1 [Morus notabilis]
MDIFTSLLCLVLILCISIQAFNSFANRPRTKDLLPPGPKPLPIIGNLLELGDKPHKSLARLSQTYGPIMCLKLGQLTTIVVSSPTMAKEVMQTHSQFFSNRTITEAARATDHSQVSVVFSPVSTLWRELRKISTVHLLAARVLDANMNLRHNKVQELLRHVHQSVEVGEAVEFGKAAFKATLNLLSTTFFSMDLADSNSDNVRELMEAVHGISEELGKPNVADYFPILKKIDPQGIRRRISIHFQKMLDLFDRAIDQRLRLRKPSSSVKYDDILDTLIDMMVIGEEKREYDHLDKNTIEHLLLDLFGAGTETTTSTFEWSMAELLKAPEIMSKAQAELEQVIGKGNQVKESDITRLPYLQAIVKETLRLHPPVPFLIPRKAESDVEVCGRTIPKDSQVLVNVWAMGRDPSIWENPNKFMPERFLELNMDFGGRDFELIPFGAGRRICPGLPLATRMLHLMLGSLLHSFDWKLEDGVRPETMNMEEKFGITLQMAQHLRAIPTARRPNISVGSM